MKHKPSWPLWITWAVIYTIVDFALDRMIHGAFLRSDINQAIEGALAAATITWATALYRWHKADAAS